MIKNAVIDIAVALILLIGLLFVIKYENKRYQDELNRNAKVENALRANTRLLELRLGVSEQQRMVLVLRFDSLRDLNQSLVQTNLKLDSTLTKIKGSYNKRTPSQLEAEMIARCRAK